VKSERDVGREQWGGVSFWRTVLDEVGRTLGVRDCLGCSCGEEGEAGEEGGAHLARSCVCVQERDLSA
jgi:hypothetical protein